ncbi:MAG: YlmH/Sll1252 family protein [Gemmiger sp.]|nr:YlmH/Sll1252 family protein [Gemmiger sp.]
MALPQKDAPALSTVARSFVPAQNDEERRLMRRVEELCETAEARSTPRYTGFLSDREQDLATAAANRVGCLCTRFWGGYPAAERKILCVEPPDAWQEETLCTLKLAFGIAQGADAPTHRDCLGALLALGLDRRCLGDLLFPPDAPNTAYLFALADKAEYIALNLAGVGRVSASAALCEGLPPEALAQPERTLQQATVPSLRADTVLAAMLHTSRTAASALITAGRVEVCHLPLKSAHEAVYAGDVFTVRGTGRFKLVGIGGKSRKDRIFISFYQY